MTAESMIGLLESATRILFFTGKGGVGKTSPRVRGGGVDGPAAQEGVAG